MIIINTKQTKEIKFDIAVAHVDIRDLTGRFIISSNDIEYGLHVKIRDNEIQVAIPPLQNVIKGLVNNQKMECRLEVIAGDSVLIPFTDTCLIKVSVEIKAKIKNESQNINLHFDELDKIINKQRAKNMAREIDDKLRFKLRRKNNNV